MTERLVCCAPGDSVSAAAKKMKDENIGPILVVEDEQGYKLVGIVTDRDLALKVVGEERDAQNTKVGDVMSGDVVTCHADDDVEKALNAMEEHQLRRIPVVDNNGRLVGIISQADVATRVDDPGKTAEVVKEISQPSH
jgi:CBS domain-containing protein